MDDDKNIGEDESVDEIEKLTPKEFAKLQRRKAYLKAKEYQKTNPKFIAMKERAKEQRREAYQRQKEYNKTRKAEQKAKATDLLQKEREEKDQELLAKVEQPMETKLPKLRLVPQIVD